MNLKFYILIGWLLLSMWNTNFAAVEQDLSFNSGNLLAEQLPEDGRVQIQYRIREPGGTALFVKLFYSEDQSTYLQIQQSSLSGDFGLIGSIPEFETKTIFFDGAKTFSGRVLSANFRLDIEPVGQMVIPTGESWTDPKFGFELIRINAGIFTMGSRIGESGHSVDESVRHLVAISKDFYIGKFEVTQEQFRAVTGFDHSNTKGDKLPTNSFSWWEITEVGGFLDLLNQAVGCNTFNFPTGGTRYNPKNVPSGCFEPPRVFRRAFKLGQATSASPAICS
jgi:hypothetical protein